MRRTPKRRDTPNRLTGILYCADCGSKLTHRYNLVQGRWVKDSSLFYTVRWGQGGKRGSVYRQHDRRKCGGFKYFRFEGENGIQVMTRGKGRGRIEIRTALDGEVIGEISIEPSGEWSLSSAENLGMLDGVQALYFFMRVMGIWIFPIFICYDL